MCKVSLNGTCTCPPNMARIGLVIQGSLVRSSGRRIFSVTTDLGHWTYWWFVSQRWFVNHVGLAFGYLWKNDQKDLKIRKTRKETQKHHQRKHRKKTSKKYTYLYYMHEAIVNWQNHSHPNTTVNFDMYTQLHYAAIFNWGMYSQSTSVVETFTYHESL